MGSWTYGKFKTRTVLEFKLSRWDRLFLGFIGRKYRKVNIHQIIY